MKYDDPVKIIHGDNAELIVVKRGNHIITRKKKRRQDTVVFLTFFLYL